MEVIILGSDGERQKLSPTVRERDYRAVPLAPGPDAFEKTRKQFHKAFEDLKEMEKGK